MLHLELQGVPAHSRPGSLRQIPRSKGRRLPGLPGVGAMGAGGAVGLVPLVARATCRVARAARKDKESWRRRKNSPLIMRYVAVGIVYVCLCCVYMGEV